MGINSGRIEIVEDVIRYTSETYPDWSIQVESLIVFGEATNQNGPFSDDHFLCFATGPALWYEASYDSDGMQPFLNSLEENLGVKLTLRLLLKTDFFSNVLWPPEIAGTPMFRYEKETPDTFLGRLLPSFDVTQRYAEHVLALLDSRQA